MLSLHAAGRARQRGFRATDLELVAAFGTETREGIVLMRRDVEALRGECTRILSRLDRLAGSAVIVRDDTVVSVYRPTRVQRKRMVRIVA